MSLCFWWYGFASKVRLIHTGLQPDEETLTMFGKPLKRFSVNVIRLAPG